MGAERDDKQLEKRIREILAHSDRPLRAAEIARALEADRSDVNAALYASADDVFGRNDDFTWELRRHANHVQRLPEDTSVRVRAYFAPDDEPLLELERLIHAAENRVLIQAFYFQSEPLAQSLIRATHRGVSVRLLLGRSSSRRGIGRDLDQRHGGRKHAVPRQLHDAGVEILEDHGDTGNHNKCAILDGRVTVTGGLNFCENAARNADNLVVIWSAAVAAEFERNWHANARLGEPFVDDHE